MLRSILIHAARSTPQPIKDWVHGNEGRYRIVRQTFSGLMRLGDGVVEIPEGPMAGLRLVVSQHTSHAHLSGKYELPVLRAIERLVAPGAICYDLGASIGYLSLLLARKARRVYAFEPAPHAGEEIRRHAAANRFDNIHIVPSPVSDESRTVRFSLTDTAFGSCIVESDSKHQVVEMTTVRLDDFAREHEFPDLIKLDVEGEEGRVLEGARTILREHRPRICCELHTREASEQVLDILREYNYRLTDLNGDPFKLPDVIIEGELHLIGLPD
jgi:FkbM family methyltransferase